MKMAVMSARFTRGRQPEPDFGREPKLVLSVCRCTSHYYNYYWHVLLCRNGFVTSLAAAREDELPTFAPVGIQSRGTWEQDFDVLVLLG